MGEKLLEEFYYGIMPSEMCYPRKKEYKQIMQLCQKTEDELKNNFTPETEKIFENYKAYMLQLTSMENEENFVQGMSLGIRMTAEAFTLGKNKKE